MNKGDKTEVFNHKFKLEIRDKTVINHPIHPTLIEIYAILCYYHLPIKINEIILLLTTVFNEGLYGEEENKLTELKHNIICFKGIVTNCF